MTIEQLINFRVLDVAFYLFFIFIAIELIGVRFFKLKGQHNLTDDGASILLGIVSAVTNGVTGFITFAVMVYFAQFRIIELPMTWWVVVLCFVVNDFRFYWHHRMVHRIRWGWAMHLVHHSSKRFSLAVALRQGWTKNFAGTVFLYIPMMLLGFDPIMIIFVSGLNTIYQFFLHTESINKYPKFIEYIFNTPSHHRVHHGSNPQYLDANYAGTLIIWDRMFGTFVAEDEKEYPDFGLVQNFETYNPLVIVTSEYWGIIKDVCQRGITIKDRLLYIFGVPGWSHDGSRKTSTDIKRDAGLYKDQAAMDSQSIRN